MSEKEVLDTVEEYVNRHQPSAYRLDVSRTDVRHDGDWWYVVVAPSQEDIRAREYSDIMEQIEDQLKAQRGLKVLLVPTQPGD